jgi:beta-lactamase regulating signal transducer with metallopeptidase domain
MDDPLRLLLTNAAAAGLIALLAWAASRTVRRQAVVHGLWLLALARLVMPPIAPLPLVPAWAGLALVSSPSSPVVVPIPTATGERNPAEVSGPASSRVARGAGTPVVSRPAARRGISRATPAPATATQTAALPAPTRPRLGWRAAAWLSLAAGALAIALLTAWRFTRFTRLLGCARPATGAVTERTSRLAARLGLSRVPPVLLVPARIPPMLWPHRGGPRLLLPAGLLPDLHGDELDALLAHELAHVRRRDHWVRLVEIAATALFWWYPVTWWARRALRRSEERCCDEWVLRLLPCCAEAYANGLLKSLAFVAQRTGALPSLASGAGPVEDIEARLKEILMTRPVPRLAAPVRLTLAAAAALGLAVFPTHAQSSAKKDEPAAPAAVAPTPAIAKTPASAAAPRPAAKPAPAARPASTPRPGPLPAVPSAVIAITPLPAPAPRPGLPPMAALTPRPAVAPMALPGPTPQAQPAPEPAIATRTRTSDPARRALDEQRRAIEEQRRQLQLKELELQGKQIEIDAQAEQADLRATADHLRAEGRADEAANVQKQARLSAQRAELQKRQLGVEKERAAVEAKVEAEAAAQQARIEALEQGGSQTEAEDAQRAMERADAAREQAEQELEKKQQAIEAELEATEKQMQELAVEDQVREMRNATDDLARSLAEQIQSLKEAAAEAPSQQGAVDHEIQRLKAALDALQSSGTSKPLPLKTPRPQP